MVPGEVCAIRSEGSKQHRKVLLNTQKSAEVIVAKMKLASYGRRTESIGVLSMTEKGGMTANGRKHKWWLVAER